MKTSQVQRIVYAMVIENTGAHFLDSGGAYGRAWQRNQNKTIKDFINEPEEQYTFDGSYISRTVSVFHYLCGLEVDDLCIKFNAKNKKENNFDADADVYGVGKNTWEWLNEKNWLMEGGKIPIQYTFNTYNGDSDLSQILQGSRLEINDDTYYLIQVHGGCDARGGYTYARLFKTAYHSDGIHEYLNEYKDSYEIIDELEYIEEMPDANVKGKVWKSGEIKSILELTS
jgi:hypothetical protein